MTPRKLSKEQADVLWWMAWHGREVWWHDVGGAATARILVARGLIAEVTPSACGTASHEHPGYMGLTEAGRREVHRMDERELARIRGRLRRGSTTKGKGT